MKTIKLFSMAILFFSVSSVKAQQNGCEVTLVNNLQANFDSGQIPMSITVSGGVAYLYGFITSEQNVVAQVYIDQYTTDLQGCPGGYSLNYDNLFYSTDTFNPADAYFTVQGWSNDRKHPIGKRK
ncbi:MAG TPA: hypothetical protein VI112_11820 [Bacteroidia bacterium]|jgi:hypothetical protein